MNQSHLKALRAVTFAALLGLGFAQVTFVPEAQAVSYRDRGYYNGSHVDKRGHYDNRRYYERGRPYYRERGRPVYVERYRERVYAPPPVVYYPPQPSGLSLIFPLNFD